MVSLPDSYVQTLPDIYRDILQSFPKIEPSRRRGYGLAIQTIHAALHDAYELGEIREACAEMARKKAVEIRNGIFVHPTELGEELVAKLSGQVVAPVQVPAFPDPPI
jgi:hypothetical protein